MLDSNTDRSYFMIGAVIVGAAIIAGALFIFKDHLFAEETGLVTKLMNTMFQEAQNATGGIGGSINMLSTYVRGLF